MSDKRRKGSLAWYNNCKRNLRNLLPVYTKAPTVYCAKVGMGSEVINGVLHPITYLQKIPMEPKTGTNQWLIKANLLNSKSVRRKAFIREISTTALDEKELENDLKTWDRLDLIGLTKGRGTLGPVARRHIKMQKRKAMGSGCTRKPGSMGLRREGKVVYTKPFSGKTGFSRRTMFGMINLGLEEVKDFTSLRYHVKEGTILKIKGSVVGPIGRIICVKKSVR